MIIGVFTGFFGAGGIERINRHSALVLATWAKKQGEEWSFLSLNDPGGIQSFSLDNQQIKFRGFGGRKAHFLIKIFNSFSRASAIFLGHPNFAPIGLVLHAVKPNLKYWVFTYGIDVWQPLSWLRRRGLLQSSAIYSLSSHTKQQLITVQKVPESKIITLPPALDPEFTLISEPPDLQDLHPKQGRFVLLTVARLAATEKHKGIEQVIFSLSRLVENHPEIIYQVVGDGADKARLEKVAQDLGLSEKVNFVGEKFGSDLQRYYANCDLFVMPSKKEGFGLVFLEAMAYGKPAIGGNHGGTPDVILDGETGFLVEYGDVAALTDRILRLLEDESLRIAMGQKGRQRVLQNFTFEHYRQRLLELIGNSLHEA